jgi:hypothetical protein
VAAAFAEIAILTTISGCGLGPRNFRKITHPAPLVRARAMSLGYGLADEAVLPALIDRLDDADVVVRLAAHEELKRRTGHDFGYLPWGNSLERPAAISRWRSWLTGRPYGKAPPQPSKSLPRPSPQVR